MEEQNILPENTRDGGEKKSSDSKVKRTLCLILAFAVAIAATAVASITVYRRLVPETSQKLTVINKLIRDYYSGEIDETTLEDALADAYMESIGDKYAFYANADKGEKVEDSIDGNASGIGVTVFNDSNSKALYVFRVDSGSPAHKAGIKVGDKIIAVDDKKVADVGFADSVKSIVREIGKTAKITLLRGEERLELQIAYEKFVRQTVYFETVGDYGYISITAFNEATVDQFKQAYKTLSEQKVKGLVFDLRDNGGGTVDSVCEILDLLVGECDLITIRYKDGKTEVSAKSDPKKCSLPMAVLTNESTASAAELFSANLRDMAKAPLIGNNTYGKGVVQRTYFLGDGSCVRFTVGEFLPAGGEGFNEKGLAPDFEVEFTEEEAKNRYILGEDEPYLKKAIEELEKMDKEEN